MKTNEAVQQLPQYKCHKVVRAGVICSWHSVGLVSVEISGTDTTIEVEVGAEWVKKHQPASGGYLVVYEDGYLSYSPAKAFESVYHELPPLGTACGNAVDAAPDEIALNAADFSDAVMWLKEGRRVARAGWRNDKYLVMSTCQWSTHAGSYEQQKIQFRATNSGGDWSASSDDMLATDWLALN